MDGSLGDILVFALIPVAATVIGGLVAAFRTPGATLQSAIQHFAAGVVFAAVAGELLPDLLHERSRLAVIVGFVLGTGLMLGVKRLTKALGGPESETGAVAAPTALLATVGVDIFVDGLLVGVGFAAGAKQGILLTLALTVEVLFLSLSAAAALARGGVARGKVIGASLGFAALLAAGAAVGAIPLRGLTGPSLAVVLAFGAAALLYLVTEELLVEAHEVPETALTTAVFFAGFLLLFVVEMTVATAGV